MKFQGKYSGGFNRIIKKYEFRFNIVTGNYEFKKRKSRKWKEYDDRHKNTMLFELMNRHVEIPTEKFNMFIESVQCSPDYDPFKSYFKELPKWDGKDHVKKFCKTITTNNEKEFRDALTRFLVGTVDCLLKPDAVNDVCLVFQGPQGAGKSRWMRNLLPKKFQRAYFYEGEIDTRNKDHVMYLSQYWFMHLDELEALRKNDIAAVKSFITRQRISLRKAYGRYKQTLVRRSSFLGSVNKDQFLSDITGNRRWLVFQVGNINYKHKLDSDLLWAQIYHLYKKGYRYWFDVEEIKRINERNEKFREVTTEEELLLQLFMLNSKKGKGEYLTATEIIKKIIETYPAFTNKVRTSTMSGILSKYALEKKIVGGLKKYYVEFVAPEAKERKVFDGDDENDNDMPF